MSQQFVVLGAGQGLRGDVPTAIQTAGSERSVLDWILHAASTLPDVELTVVAGFGADQIRGSYPDVHVAINPHWENSGPACSLAYAGIKAGIPLWITYADVVYRAELLEALAAVGDVDISVAVDSTWLNRYGPRSSRDLREAEKVLLDGDSFQFLTVELQSGTESRSAEFCGVVRLSARASRFLQEAFKAERWTPSAGIVEILQDLMASGFSAHAVDIGGAWAELNAPQDLARFVLGTKAESLGRLRPLVRKSKIGSLLSFSHEKWRAEREACLQQIHDRFTKRRLIVRSSAIAEDSWTSSAAGEFESILDVDSEDPKALAAAVDRVFASYGEENREDHVLVQGFLSQVRSSGVVMTRTPLLSAPYYVINFDTVSGRTDTVTSGVGGSTRIAYLRRGAELSAALVPDLQNVMNAIYELETLVGHDSLDIEYAVTTDDEVHVLQVRPIASTFKHIPVDDQQITAGLLAAKKDLDDQMKPGPFVVGSSTQLSVMADWNPAEIVGAKPRRLAFSLYRYLITDDVWAAQRARNGYRDVRPCPLLLNVLEHPYVDVRATFNSFIPATVTSSLAARLVDRALAQLRKNPGLHDKVEFDILQTCLDFNFKNYQQRLSNDGFSESEINEVRLGLRDVTLKTIKSCSEDLKTLDRQELRLSAISQSRAEQPLRLASELLEEIRREGTPVFANLARAGFVAVSFLRSLEAVGAISPDEREAFHRSVNTVSGKLQSDAARVARSELNWNVFVKRYGHLRPGTYDITSDAYHSAPETYLRPMVDSAKAESAKSPLFTWGPATRARIESALTSSSLDLSVDELSDFIRSGIEGREFSKFVFTRGLSMAIEAIADFGSGVGLSRDELAHLNLSSLLALLGTPTPTSKKDLLDQVQSGRDAFHLGQALCLPGHIATAEAFDCFEQEKTRGNFVTRKKASGPTAFLSASASSEHSGGFDETSKSSPIPEIDGAVVLIENADPGFDWIFGRKIAALITQYGGVNSHMAIRCAEFGIPAAIGVGEVTFNELRTAQALELDCEIQQLRILLGARS